MFPLSHFRVSWLPCGDTTRLAVGATAWQIVSRRWLYPLDC